MQLEALVENAKVICVQAPMPPEELAMLVWEIAARKIRNSIRELRTYIATETTKLKEEEKAGHDEVLRLWNEDHLEQFRAAIKTLLTLSGLTEYVGHFDQCEASLMVLSFRDRAEMPRIDINIPRGSLGRNMTPQEEFYACLSASRAVPTRLADFAMLHRLEFLLRYCMVSPASRAGEYYTELVQKVEATETALYQKVEQLAKLTQALGRGQEVIDIFVHDLVMQRLQGQAPETAEALEAYSDTMYRNIVGGLHAD